MADLVVVEKDLSYLIVQIGYEVINELGPGFDDDIYENPKAVNQEKNHKKSKQLFEIIENKICNSEIEFTWIK